MVQLQQPEDYRASARGAGPGYDPRADTLYVLAHTRTYRVHTEYDHAL